MTLLTDPPISRKLHAVDVLRMSDNASLELVNGLIVEKNVSVESSEVELIFGARILAYLSEHPVAKVYPGTLGYQCFPEDPEKFRKPDASVVSLERLKTLPEPNPGYMPIPPDLAIEVLSPNDVTYQTDNKIKEYFGAGFPLIWVADPNLRTITVYSRNGRPAIFTENDEITAESALPGFRCKVRDFFPATVSAGP